MDKYTQYNIDQSALITIDIQNNFTLDNAPAMIAGTQEIIPNIVRLLDVFRNIGLPVIHVIRLYQRDGSNSELYRKQMIEAGTAITAPDTKGAERVDALKPD